MKNLKLTFYQRISLWNRIGTLPASSLKEAAVYLRIIDQLRPTDTEMKETQLTLQDSNYRWNLPKPNYGDRTFEIEDEEAAAIVTGLENHPQPVIVGDAAWMLMLVADLKGGPSVVKQQAVEGKKKRA